MSYTLLGVALVGSVFLIGFFVVFSKTLIDDSSEDLKALRAAGKSIKCPNCKKDVTENILKTIRGATLTEMRFRCQHCNQLSHWNISGFPPTPVESKAS